ncbi:glycerol-3-phosphate dehydrogenase, partial [Flavobacteriaceae bacterium]|nr:glycerol-3-phosphate dehydrogenase [Flavobacteriaceae bacterium]
RRFSREFKKTQTEHIVLSGGKFENFDDVKRYINLINKRVFKDNFSEKDAQYLVYNYGKQTDVILKKYNELKKGTPQEKMIKAEVWYTIHYEMTCSLTDFFIRRTGRAYFNIESVYKNLTLVLDEFAKHLSWKKEILNKKKEELNKALEFITSFN